MGGQGAVVPVLAGAVPPGICPCLGRLRGVNLTSMGVIFQIVPTAHAKHRGFGTRSLYLESPQGSPSPEHPQPCVTATRQTEFLPCRSSPALFRPWDFLL